MTCVTLICEQSVWLVCALLLHNSVKTHLTTVHIHYFQKASALSFTDNLSADLTSY